MKTIIKYVVVLILLALTACSKKTATNSSAKFPDDIASTWARSATGSASDTVTDQGTGEKWVNDKVILSSSEAVKLQGMIQAVPRQIKDDFAAKGKKVSGSDFVFPQSGIKLSGYKNRLGRV
ncbi:hypothetical protein [Niabella hirudinis]|uniref:hypothetical protein n=1 Tax=Niabella hirudinis TaxID=1285929 RepID=UPI003EBB99CE